MIKICQKKIIIYQSIFLLIFLLLFPSISHAALEPAYSVLKDTSSGMGEQVKTVWQTLINLVNSFIIILLIVTAFSQILRLNINTYGIKKILPTLIFAIIAANFSFLFCRLLIDVANVLVGAFLEADKAKSLADSAFGDASWASASTMNVKEAIASGGQWGQVLWFVFAQLIVFATAIIILILAYLFMIRLWVIYFLVALSPLGFMAIVLPQTKGIFNQWWSNFLKWAFMPVVSVFWLWLGGVWVGTIRENASGDVAFVSTFLFGGVCFYLAITTPFKMGGAIMKTWAGIPGRLGKYAGNTTAGKTVKAWGAAKLQEQGAKGKWYNPVGNYMRMKQLGDMRIKHYEGRGKDYGDKMSARLIKTKAGRGFENEARKWGGDVDLVKEEVTKDYLASDEGKAWAKNRASHLRKLGMLKAQTAEGLSAGDQENRDSAEGREMARDTVFAQKQKEMYDSQIANEDKLLITDFNYKAGVFAGEDFAPIIDQYFEVMALGKKLDEAVSNSSSKQIERVLGDQVSLQNMVSAINNYTKELLDISRPGGQLDILEQESKTRDLSVDEIDTMTRLTDRRAFLEEEIPQVIQSAKGLLSDRQGNKQHHLDGMLDQDELGNFLGFAGLIGGNKRVGNLMMTRAGKLMSIEIKADADKLLDRMTIEEISSEIKNGAMDGSFSLQNIENFKNGKQHFNSPEANRQIEGRMIAISKIAKQNNHPENSSAREAMVSMLSDDAAKQAARKYNELADKRGLKDMYNKKDAAGKTLTDKISESLSSSSIRVEMEKRMSRTSYSPAVFAAVTNQRNIGLSDNPAAYLSTSPQRNQSLSATTAETKLSPLQYRSILETTARAAQVSQGSYSKLVDALGANKGVAVQTLDEFKSHCQYEKNSMASAIGKAVGINFNQEARKELHKALSNLSLHATPEQVAMQLNPVIEKYNGKKLEQNSTINVGGKDKTTELSLDKIAQKANIIMNSEKAVKILGAEKKVTESLHYLEHFKTSKVSQDQINTISLELNNALGQIEQRSVSPEQIPEFVHTVLAKFSLGPKSTKSSDDPMTSLSTLRKFVDAAKVARQSFRKDNTELDISLAKDIIANEELKKTQND